MAGGREMRGRSCRACKYMIEALRAQRAKKDKEIERLKTELDNWVRVNSLALKQLEKAEAENAELRRVWLNQDYYLMSF